MFAAAWRGQYSWNGEYLGKLGGVGGMGGYSPKLLNLSSEVAVSVMVMLSSVCCCLKRPVCMAMKCLGSLGVVGMGEGTRCA